jgi:hypothetical protein
MAGVIASLQISTNKPMSLDKMAYNNINFSLHTHEKNVISPADGSITQEQ